MPKLRVVTSTYLLDIETALRLNRQLVEHVLDVTHHLFVEQRDYAAFESRKTSFGQQFDLRVKPDGGGGGLGRSGSLCRSAMHAQILPLVGRDETVANIDSDTFFQNVGMLADVMCNPGETRGFTGLDYGEVAPLKLIDGTSFKSMSGMLISAHAGVYTKAWKGVTQEVTRGICQLLMDSGHGCSEDVVAAYLYQVRGSAVAVSHETKYTRSIRGPALSRIYPSVEAGYPADVDVIA